MGMGKSQRKQAYSEISNLFEHLNLCINSRHGEIGDPAVPPPQFKRREDALYTIFRGGKRFEVRVVEVDGEEI